jgi:ATP-dependent RNA helicase RhlE
LDFNNFDLHEDILSGITSLGFKSPTPIQEQTLPIVLANKDLIGCAQTGTGKTGAFLIPILSKIAKNKTGKVNTLIIVPTRELAVQIDQQAEGMAYFAGISTYSIYGGGTGQSFDQEKKALIEGADIIIATPGRLIMHLNQNYVDFSSVEHLILDEADRMLDMGFQEALTKIIGHIPKKRQTLMFSATMPARIRQLASSILNNPEQINIAISRPAEKITQSAYMVYEEQKPGLFVHLIEELNPKSTIVFTSSRQKVKDILRELKRLKTKAKGISSDLDQKEREDVLMEFRARQLPILVATDVLSRGIDIEGIDLVVNYDAPAEPEDYIHRIGRTARAEAKGQAITFITPKDQNRFRRIEKLMEMSIDKPNAPEFLGSVPEYSTEYKKSNTKKNFKKKKPGTHKPQNGNVSSRPKKESGKNESQN